MKYPDYIRYFVTSRRDKSRAVVAQLGDFFGYSDEAAPDLLPIPAGQNLPAYCIAEVEALRRQAFSDLLFNIQLRHHISEQALLAISTIKAEAEATAVERLQKQTEPTEYPDDSDRQLIEHNELQEQLAAEREMEQDQHERACLNRVAPIGVK